MTVVGVDIGAHSIKIAEIDPVSKGFVIRRVQEIPLSLDLTKDKKIEIIDSLRTLFSNYERERTQFVFSVPQSFVSARLLHFPFRERFKVQKAMVSQLEDELPFSQEDAVFDAKILRYVGKGADVLAMAVPKERVAEVLQTASDCGVEPMLVSSEALGLSNLFEAWNKPPPEVPALAQDLPTARKTTLVLNIGHLSTEMLVYGDSMLIAVRNVDWGGKAFADALGKKYGLNYIQALREVQTKGFILLDKSQGTKEQAAFSAVIESSLDPLLSDLKLKMLELQSDLQLEFSEGFLLGGGSQIKNLGGFLTQHLQIPFNRFKVFEKFPVSFEYSPHLEISAGVAVGLALEGLKRPLNPATNFLRGEFARQNYFFQQLVEKWQFTAKILAAAFVLFLGFSLVREEFTLGLVEKTDSVLKQLAEEVANLKGSKASSSGVRSFIRNQEKLEKSRMQAERALKLNSALSVVEQLSRNLTKNMATLEIKRVSILFDQAEVQGYAANPSEVAKISEALKKISNNNKIETTQSRITVPKGKQGFAYRFKVNRFTGGS